MSASDNDRAGDLLIQEVDEDLRREQYQRLWRRHGNHAIGAVLAIVLIVAGYQGWQSWQASRHQAEAAAFASAEDLVAQGKKDDGLAALAKIGTDSKSGYGIAARMQRAALLADQGDTKGAAAGYEDIISSSAPKTFRDLAVVKATLLELDTGDAAQLEKRLAPIAEAGNPWHYSANELLALLAQKKGDNQRAADLYKQIADDLQAPSGVRARAAEMLAVLGPSTSTPAPAEPAKPNSDKAKG